MEGLGLGLGLGKIGIKGRRGADGLVIYSILWDGGSLWDISRSGEDEAK